MTQDNSIFLQDVRLTLAGPAGPVNVLNDVNLAVGAGETVSVMGPSGSGKTTMLMVTAGLEKPSSGVVQVAGQDLAALNEDQLARFRRGRISIVFQAFHLAPAMTAVENVALPLEFMGAADAFDRARQELNAVGLAGRAAHYPAQLSGGEQQRVALARAFAPKPQILLADEPTGNLDEDTGKRVMDLMFDMAGQTSAALVLITHDARLAGRCSRMVRMVQGHIYEPGETSEPA